MDRVWSKEKEEENQLYVAVIKNKCPNPFPGDNSQRAGFQKEPGAHRRILRLFGLFLWVKSLDNAVER